MYKNGYLYAEQENIGINHFQNIYLKQIKNKNMTSRDFAYWLQGYFEINPDDLPNKEQINIIKKHLNIVFKHEIDPSMGDAKHQMELNNIHNNNSSGPDGVLRC
jgi:hypothetical protein